jgi:RNA polymerase sigma factor (sigma-70 family)
LKEEEAMSDSPATRASLLVRLRDRHDNRAWSEFVDLYAPLVYRFACKHGLQDADAADLTQDTLRAVAGAIGRLDYDPKRGAFRGWLFTIVRNRLRDFMEKRRRQDQGSGDTAMLIWLAQQPEPANALAEDWDREYDRQLLLVAAERIRGDFQENTWQAFWCATVNGQSGKQVADALKMTVAAVYLAKSRVMARLKEAVRRLQEEIAEETGEGRGVSGESPT